MNEIKDKIDVVIQQLAEESNEEIARFDMKTTFSLLNLTEEMPSLAK